MKWNSNLKSSKDNYDTKWKRNEIELQEKEKITEKLTNCKKERKVTKQARKVERKEILT